MTLQTIMFNIIWWLYGRPTDNLHHLATELFQPSYEHKLQRKVSHRRKYTTS